MITELQQLFLQELRESLGVVSKALSKTNVTRDEYNSWLVNKEFKQEVDNVNELSIDYVENKLLGQIQKGDLAAIQFYLKTKGKKRGY
jgi:hypothetical protein